MMRIGSGHHDMIDDLDVERPADLIEVLCCRDIVFARRRISAWMIMDEDDAGRIVLSVELPPNATLEETERKTEEIYAAIINHYYDAFEDFKKESLIRSITKSVVLTLLMYSLILPLNLISRISLFIVNPVGSKILSILSAKTESNQE